ncbi:ATP synthase delta chain, chloroplastic-like protein [Cinnamomum micranthum f. kanehirae]|uniref:ATP synthase delta chain, chloroplastic-like protein n=1 Tax=Cinnamomum micranthum f. kanehirae TaxID=337451 RepID=A0A3S3NU69_9MAGN|nr:ATP synthase delta chain, chloroplastic-like protein [Cinnamomum micranthum f. kanehirae]
MNILNQSIPSHGQPAFPSKGANHQDNSQHLPVAYSRQRNQSLKKNALFTASGYPNQGESSSKKLELESKTHKKESVDYSVCKLPRLFKDEDDLNHLLTQPISQSKQGGSGSTVSGDPETEFTPFTLSFLHSLMENEKLNLIKDAMGEIDLFSHTPNNVLVVAVSSAVKLESNQIDQIARKMRRVTGSSNLRLEETVDPSLIAGFVVKYEKEGSSHVIDLSVKGQLAHLVARIEYTDQKIASHGEVGVV